MNYFFSFVVALSILSSIGVLGMMVLANNDTITAHERSHEQACLYFGGNPTTTLSQGLFYLEKGEVYCDLANTSQGFELASAMQEVQDYQSRTMMYWIMGLVMVSNIATWGMMCVMALRLGDE